MDGGCHGVDLAKADHNGWNSQNANGMVSWLRCSIITCKFREEILVLSLGTVSPLDLQERALYVTLPAFLFRQGPVHC